MSGRMIGLLLAIALIGFVHRYNQPAPMFGHAKLEQPAGVIVAPDGPKQIDYTDASRPSSIRLKGATLKPLARFEFDARLLSTVWYSSGREANFSPIDLGLSWGKMSDSANINALSWDHSGRFLLFRFAQDPPIPLPEITRSIANVHIVVRDQSLLRQLGRLKIGSRIRGHGQLVEINAPDGWAWRSSLSRTDDGAGACELLLLESVY